MAKANSGDIVVLAFPGGYVVGRVRTPADRKDLSFEYIRTEVEAAAAVKFAEQLADRAGVSAWVCEGAVEFREISRKGSAR